MFMSVRLCLTIVAVLCIVSCEDQKTERAPSNTFVAPNRASDTLVIGQGPAGESVVRGFGFIMPVPAGTTVERKAEGGVVYYDISGPLSPTPSRTPDQGPSEPQPIFQISVSVAGHASPASLDAFVDSLRRASNADADAGIGLMEPASAYDVGGRRALLLQPPCGDCAAEEVYVGDRGRVMLFGYSFGIHLSGTPAEQRPIMRRILDGIRWVQRQ